MCEINGQDVYESSIICRRGASGSMLPKSWSNLTKREQGYWESISKRLNKKVTDLGYQKPTYERRGFMQDDMCCFCGHEWRD